jgi:hypothetical protein
MTPITFSTPAPPDLCIETTIAEAFELGCRLGGTARLAETINRPDQKKGGQQSSRVQHTVGS